MPSIVSDKRAPNLYFNYNDDAGRVVAQKVRIDLGRGEKTFYQRQRVFDFWTYESESTQTPYRDRDGRWWVNCINDDWIKSLPYRPDAQQKLIDDAEPRQIYVTEGERDADAITDQGEVATTLIQFGRESDWAECFRGYKGVVLVVVDNDPVGASQGLAKRKALVDVGVKVELCRPPEGHKDVRDLLEAGGALSDLRTVAVAQLKEIAKTATAERVTRDGYSPLFSEEYKRLPKPNTTFVNKTTGERLSKEQLMEQRKSKRRTSAKATKNGSTAKAGRSKSEQFPARKRLPPPTSPMRVARVLEGGLKESGYLTLYHWGGTWWEWQGPNWREIKDAKVRSLLYRVTEDALYAAGQDARPTPWDPNKSRIGNLMEALAAIVHLDESVEAPSWLNDVEISPDRIVATPSGLLEVPSRELYELTPGYFNLVSVPFDYDPEAPVPERWQRFLRELWPRDKDQEQIDQLQEWFGYVISGRTDLQKVFGIFGAERSGKGTITRLLGKMVGGSVAGPTIKKLGEHFGMQNMVGKSLAVISDVRMGDRTDNDVVIERLLTVSGEDIIDVPRKNTTDWTGKLSTRIMMLSNVEPDFRDASGVIASRFIALEHTISWLGKEDPKLEGDLEKELPGILNWALDGLDRLNRQGRFTDSVASRRIRRDMRGRASPAKSFIADECETGSGYKAPVDAVWERWQAWCEANGHKRVGTKQSLGRNLRAAYTKLDDRRIGPKGRQIRYWVGLRLKDEDQKLRVGR